MINAKVNSMKRYIPFIIAGFVIFLVYELYPFIDGLLGAIILYVLLRPLMQRLIKRKWRKGLAAPLLMIASFVAVLLPVFWLSYLFVSKMTVIFSESSFIVQTFHSLDEKIQALTGFQLFSKE